jgi:hypothetical protein
VSEYDREASIMRGPWFTKGSCAMEGKSTLTDFRNETTIVRVRRPFSSVSLSYVYMSVGRSFCLLSQFETNGMDIRVESSLTFCCLE